MIQNDEENEKGKDTLDWWNTKIRGDYDNNIEYYYLCTDINKNFNEFIVKKFIIKDSWNRVLI